MRTFPPTSVLQRGCFLGALLIGAGALYPALAKNASPLPAPNWAGIVSLPAVKPGSFQDLRQHLSSEDRKVALRALHIALDRLSDGAAFVWRSHSNKLTGTIRTTMAFRDAQRRICRHLIYTVSLGPYKKQVEGIACRGFTGRWMISG